MSILHLSLYCLTIALLCSGCRSSGKTVSESNREQQSIYQSNTNVTSRQETFDSLLFQSQEANAESVSIRQLTIRYDSSQAPDSLLREYPILEKQWTILEKNRKRTAEATIQEQKRSLINTSSDKEEKLFAQQTEKQREQQQKGREPPLWMYILIGLAAMIFIKHKN